MFKHFTILLLAGVLSLTACSVPTSDYRVPDSGAPVVANIEDDPRWEYVSAEQNALDQLRDKNAVAAGFKAADAFGCPTDYFCLYHWINYEGGRWQTHANFWNDFQCWNFAGSTFTDGYSVNNSSASLISNRYWAGWPKTRIELYDWQGCNAGGQVWLVDHDSPTFKTNLHTMYSPSAYHKFTSILFYRVQP
jgi:hypothetical protein